MEPYADLPRVVTLNDASRALIRELVPEDEPYLREGFESLSRRSRELRFLSADLKPHEADYRYLVRPDGVDHLALAMERYPIVGDDRIGIGVARCVRLPEQRDTAEVAVVVADEWQRRGAGVALLAAMRDCALAASITRFWGLTRIDNEAIFGALARVAVLVDKKVFEPGVYETTWALVPAVDGSGESASSERG